MSKYMLKINDDKTIFLLISSKHREAILFPEIQVGNVSVAPSNHAKNLGVVFDSFMTMERQINTLVKQCYYHIRRIGKIKGSLTPEAKMIVVNAFIMTKLDYGNALLVGLPKHLIRKLQCIQNAAAWIVSGARKYDHITPVLKQLHWLPVAKRIDFKVLLLAYKCAHGLAPNYLTELLEIQNPGKGLRSNRRLVFRVPKTQQVTYGDRAFCKAASTLWNNLPEKICNSATVDIFKRKLKTHLYTEAYDSKC